MPDIFNRTTDVFGGSFSADDVQVTFPQIRDAAGGPGAEVGLITQRLNINYQQQVTRLYEVGQPHIYYVGGRASGQVGMDRVAGPRALSAAFYSSYGDVCRVRDGHDLDFTLGANCNEQGIIEDQVDSVSYTALLCVITGVSVGVQANDMLINESMQIMFSSLNYEVNGGGAVV